MATYKFTRHPPPISIYTRFRVKNSMRALRSPRVAKAWRTRKLMNLTAFFRNRFYEIDRWYKARIDKPEVYPTCYTIDPDEHYKSLAERMEDLRLDQNADRQFIDIGPVFDQEKFSGKDKVDFPVMAKDRADELEKLARLRQLCINPADIESDSRTESVRIRLAKSMADHFRIFRDLFHSDAYFYPTINLHVGYVSQDNPSVVNPVFYGNILSPIEASKEPEVHYIAEGDSLYTLLLINPDGCPYGSKGIVHWLVCNIPGSQIDKGDTLCPYLQPLPLRGTGYHRMVFVLFKQEKSVESFVGYKIPNPVQFKTRTFDAPDFYLKNEDLITPVGLVFFQSSWDKSCTDCFHNYLNMEQPIYDYEWPGPYVPPQEEFPNEYQPFNE